MADSNTEIERLAAGPAMGAGQSEGLLRNAATALTQMTGYASDFGVYIAKLTAGRAWESLGYAGLDEMIADRLGGALENLNAAMRRTAVAELHHAGLSSRAIAPIVGVSHTTIIRDVQTLEHNVPGDRAVTPETQRQGDPVHTPDIDTAVPTGRIKPYVHPHVEAKRKMVSSLKPLKLDISSEHIAALDQSDRDDLIDKARARIAELTALVNRVESG